MTHIKSFNESVKDLMTPKPMEEVKKSLESLSPYKALIKARQNKMDDEFIKLCLERTIPINKKLYQDTKKFNKINLLEFVEFVSTWIDEQGGESYDIEEKFRNIAYDLSNHLEEDEEWEDDEGNVTKEEGLIEESIYSDNTVNAYKELMISYVIDYVSHTTYGGEEEDGDGAVGTDEDWEFEEEEEVNDDDHDDEDEYDEDVERHVEREIHEIEEEERLERLEKKKSEKEKEEKKPINKIKKFLGFNNDNKSK